MEFLKELTHFLVTRKKFWLVPLVFILLFLSLLIALTASSALVPIIYSLR